MSTIKHLYTGTETRVKIGCKLSHQMYSNKGLKQGCLFRPPYLKCMQMEFSKNGKLPVDIAEEILYSLQVIEIKLTLAKESTRNR